jgi:iron complex outermembrane receptor protein
MMYKRNPGRTLVTSLAAVAALSVPYCETAFAEDDVIEEIIVTGSRIKRDGFSSSSPLDVFDESDVMRAGVASIDEFLKDIPAFTGYQMGTSTNNGSDVGQIKFDMCGLKLIQVSRINK